ncbi:helix-turn-helix transcriptional regulator [Tardiphaga sp. P9-11]|uniref:helix-turn-helix domain-containing protein n=1 Tax=Tardiphaga sp. P9-11 TaxID=2024614 RepID=UPI0024C09DCA|nr:helix-turn-helix transcriptional regulator [Tardiphaga sp. P9-11]
MREGRIEKGLSQAAIGEAMGVSLQQMRKYERVANRISAGTLYGICYFLNYPIGKLFEPANAKRNGTSRDTANGQLAWVRVCLPLLGQTEDLLARFPANSAASSD